MRNHAQVMDSWPCSKPQTPTFLSATQTQFLFSLSLSLSLSLGSHGKKTLKNPKLKNQNKFQVKITIDLRKVKMAYLLPNLSPSLLISSSSKSKPNSYPTKPINFNLCSSSSSSSSTSTTLTNLQSSTLQDAQVNLQTAGAHDNQQQNQQQQQRDDFYVNLGLAVRTLREDLPLLFSKDLNYDIYRYFSHLGDSFLFGC